MTEKIKPPIRHVALRSITSAIVLTISLMIYKGWLPAPESWRFIAGVAVFTLGITMVSLLIILPVALRLSGEDPN